MSTQYAISVTPDRTEAFYPVGARIGFAVNVTGAGAAVTGGAVDYVLRRDLITEMERGTLALGGETKVHTRLDAPGFVDCAVTYRPPRGDAVTAAVSAAVDPLDIRPSVPTPADFDDFWDSQLALLAAVPPTAELTPHPSWDDAIEVFDTRVAALGDVPVSGYFARPIGARPATLPALLTVHGAGVRGAAASVAILCAQRNWLAMDINAHGLPNGRHDAWYEARAKNELANYRHDGCLSRETCYFVGMFLRVRRALDFLAAQPQWNRRVLMIQGHSQGGYQALAGAALDPRVTAFAAGVPAGCDHTGFVVGRPTGWPNFPNGVASGDRGLAAQAAPYVDGVNFAGRTRAEGFFSVGFRDASCNPVGVYAAYNNHRGPKRMLNCPAMGHEAPPVVDGEFTRWLLEHARTLSSR